MSTTPLDANSDNCVGSGPSLPARSLSNPNGNGNACSPLPPSLSLSALDLHSIRQLILSHLHDLDARLSSLEHVFADDAKSWAADALDLLRSIKHDVHLYVLSHTNSIPDAARTKMPDLSISDSIESVRARIHLPEHPLKYLALVQQHLHDLHTRLLRLQHFFESRSHTLSVSVSEFDSIDLPIPSIRSILDAIDRVLSPDANVSVTALSSNIKERVQSSVETLASEARTLEHAALEYANAMRLSLEGSKLIGFHELPAQWRSNRFVRTGYRFIPLSRWPLLVLSLFAFHNETLNIHTHLLPLLHSLLPTLSFLPFFFATTPTAPGPDLAERAFTLAVQTCLLCSVTWHTMAGCAHHRGMELSARVDYVGISWLISTSIGTVVYYGLFACHPHLATLYLYLCAAAGVAGTVCPFMGWFNDGRWQYKKWRIAFFVSMALSGLAPLAHLSYIYGVMSVVRFSSPLYLSFACYTTGLVFYATQFPESYFSDVEMKPLSSLSLFKIFSPSPSTSSSSTSKSKSEPASCAFDNASESLLRSTSSKQKSRGGLRRSYSSVENVPRAGAEAKSSSCSTYSSSSSSSSSSSGSSTTEEGSTTAPSSECSDVDVDKDKDKEIDYLDHDHALSSSSPEHDRTTETLPHTHTRAHGRLTFSHLLDHVGGGSHALWHLFVVLAIYQHKWGMREMKGGVGGGVC